MAASKTVTFKVSRSDAARIEAAVKAAAHIRKVFSQTTADGDLAKAVKDAMGMGKLSGYPDLERLVHYMGTVTDAEAY